MSQLRASESNLLKARLFDAILFDLDGVLVDSRAVIRRHWQHWAVRHDFDIDQVLEVAHGRRPVDTVRILLQKLGNPAGKHAETLAADIVAGEASDAEGLKRLPGVCELVNNLPTANWTVATSGPRAIAEFRLRYAGVNIPPTMVTAEDVEQGKPAPDPYLLAAKRLGTTAEKCVVIEDAAPGVRAGVAAGATVIGLTTTHAADQLLEAGATVVLRDLSELRALYESEGQAAPRLRLDPLPR